jgi:hypothetical protein
MASDRGTIPRTSPGGADHQASWNEPTLPAGRRMPSAPRERRPLLVVLALLLVLVGAGGAGLLIQRMNTKVAVIEVTQTIPEGQPITAADLSEVEISSDSNISAVAWSNASQVTKFVAAVTIPAGTLLTEKMASPANNLVNGRDTVGLALKDGQVPGDLQVGDTVDIYSTATTTTGCPGAAGHELAINATVLSVTAGGSGTGETNVEVAVDGTSAGAVACNTANGTAALAVVPGNG